MKNIPVVLFFLFTAVKVFSQTDPATTGKEDKAFMFVELMPEFPGGQDSLSNFLGQNISYPANARDSSITGKVILQFIIETDGTVGNIKVLRGVGGGCTEEAVRVLKIMPKWKPGMQSGVPVRVYFNLPVIFSLTGEEEIK